MQCDLYLCVLLFVVWMFWGVVERVVVAHMGVREGRSGRDVMNGGV